MARRRSDGLFGGFSKLRTHHQTAFAFVIGIAVVMFWRAIWGLLDLYFFPEDYAISLWMSLIVSIIILTASHFLIRELA